MVRARLSAEAFALRAQRVRLLVLDVDGVLTDGSIVYDPRGEEIKRFHVRDGFGVRCWQRAGHEVAVISGRYSPCTAVRCRELGIGRVIQSSPIKAPAYRELLSSVGCEASETCVLGDDLPDLPLLLSAGIGAAVADADAAVLGRVDWVTQAEGGRGAVREIIEALLAAQGRWQEVIEHYAREAIPATNGIATRVPRRE